MPALPAPAATARSIARRCQPSARIDVANCLPYSGPECGACADACPIPGALNWEGGVRPVIDQESCAGCALCREACILDPKAIQISALVPDDKAVIDS